ncbi:MAG: histidine phosphatase family protein [Deltaproteobacteria bacterium]|nr:histidine phosphatase family protein [Deltaproteobacteria bacterium]
MSKPDGPCTRLFLVRHGEVVAEAQGKFLGFTDAELSPRGREQLRTLARRLQAEVLDRAYASDLKRAVESARILCRGRSLVPEERAEFREMDMGDWDGKAWQEIDRLYPGRKKFHFSNLNQFHFPNGEYWNPFRSRVVKGVQEIIRENPGKNILLVAHAGVNRIIIAQALKLPFKNMFFLDQAYAGLNIIEYYSGYAMVKLMNGTFLE